MCCLLSRKTTISTTHGNHNRVHGPEGGHEPVPHGNHIAYRVDGHLHHPQGDHCDDHGPLSMVS
jgi:hypothetical protein